MRTIRRLYFYAVALVSLEVVLWGMIGLARSISGSPSIALNNADQLARGLALTLVGVPVFVLHWWWAQRNARQEMEEHASGVRSVFLYAALLASLVPIVQNFLALLNRELVMAFGLRPNQALVGPFQTMADNLIAMLMNAVVAGYLITVVRADWKSIEPQDAFSDVRRIYRYIWVLLALVYVVVGCQQLLRFIFTLPSTVSGTLYPMPLANGLALEIVGTPIWYLAWKTVQDSRAERVERESLLRLGVLYFLALAGVVTVLATGGVVVDVILRLIFGERMAFTEFLQRVSLPLSIGIPLAGIWAYFGRWLERSMSEFSDQPRQAGMRRLYRYILSAIGLGASFVGLSLLLSFVVDAAIGDLLWADTLRPRLAEALASIATGLPLWALTWRPIQAEVRSPGDPGDHAQRSLLRRVYLYLVLFISVVGGMLTAVSLFNALLRALFGRPLLFRTILDAVELLFLFAGMGIYHGLVLRADGRRSASALAERHAAFPVLVFDTGDGSFAQSLQSALKKQAPRLPVTVQAENKPVVKEAKPKAVVLPADLALDPPESLRRWLDKFNGERLVIPRTAAGWTWVGGQRPLPAAAQQTAIALRLLAEGQPVRMQAGTSGWTVVAYVLASLFALELLLILIGSIVSLITS